MNLTTIKNAVTSRAGRQALKLQKNSPTLLVGAGVVGVVATAVLASKATLGLEEVLDEHEEKLAKRATLIREGNPKYTEQMSSQDLVLIHVQTAGKIARLYGPALLVGTATVSCFVSSHNILNRRNAALTAAYATVDKAFKEYRERVREQLGDEIDERFASDTETIEETDENGKKTTREAVAVEGRHSPYATFFDQYNNNWNKSDPSMNVYFLRMQQSWLNDRLKARGHVFLNEVYDMLGLPRTKAGAVVGWVYGSGGDDYIDFGLYRDGNEDSVYDFLTGRESAILLDFNVDGVIYDKI